MLTYILRRLLIAIPTLFLVITLTFFLMRAAPGGPFTMARKLPPQIEKNVAAKYGMDKPLPVQFGNYLLDIAQGDFGPSLKYLNRPDGESPDQPPSGKIEDAARAAGLDYVHIPVMGGPTQAQAQAMHEACNGADGPVLAYCRSGTRSITTWAFGELMAQTTPREDLARLGAAAGYDLRPVLGV